MIIRYDHIDDPNFGTMNAVLETFKKRESMVVHCATVFFAIKPWPKKPLGNEVLLVPSIKSLSDVFSPERSQFKLWHQNRSSPFMTEVTPMHRWCKQHHWPLKSPLSVVHLPLKWCFEASDQCLLVIDEVAERGNHPLIVVDEGYSMMNHIENI